MTIRVPAFTTASILFFLSGMVGLGYELIWIRKAALVVGSSQIALSTVLTAFFLGLALGSYVVGQFLRTGRRSPLLVYGLFEVAIGGFALAFPWLFDAMEAAYGAFFPLFAGSGIALFALRFGLLFVLFLVPTTFMGGTLPLLLDGLVEKDASIGPRTSILYGINILGAVAGVLLTSYWAIPALGLDGTSLAGACCNLGIGLAAVALFRGLPAAHPEVERPPLGLFFPSAAFASGLLAIGYQVAWNRYFSLFQTGTVYLTAVLLAVYLLALAAGSFYLAPLLARRLKPLWILGVVQAAIPIVALQGLEWWRKAEYRFAIQGQRLPTGELAPIDTLEIDFHYRYFWRLLNESADATFAAPLFQVALVLFVPVALIGAGLPAVLAAATRHSAGIRSVSGRLLFWNTVGSSAGGFVTGFAFLPILGLHRTLVALGLGSALLSAAAMLRAMREAPAASQAAGTPGRREKRRAARAEGGAAGGRETPQRGKWALAALSIPAAAAIIVTAFAFGRPDVSEYTIRYHGYGRDPELGHDPDRPDARDPSSLPALEVIEGPVTTSFLFEDAESVRIGSGNVCLAVAYKKIPSSQAIQGHLPCLFYPGEGLPGDCLGICLGSGQSFGALLLYPIRKLDVVDISPEITDLCLRRFVPYHHDLAKDPRVNLHLDDGRHFVERAPTDSYDVVSMEPPPPTAEGVSSLYSVEFCEEVARILRPGGVFMQWLPLYRVTPLDAKGIIKTQAQVFPETFVVKAFNDDFMVVSYESRPTFRVDALRQRVSVLETERLVRGQRWNPRCRHDIASLVGVMSFLMMGPATVQGMEAPMVYHDDNQILSYSSGDRWLLRRYEGPVLSRLSFAALRISPFEELKGYFDPPLDAAMAADAEIERAASLGYFNVADPSALAADRTALEAATQPSERLRLALRLATAADASMAKEEALGWVEVALGALDGNPGIVLPEHEAAARAIARSAAVALAPIVEAWLPGADARHPGSRLVAAMREELRAFRRREEERLSGYLLR